MDNIFVPSNCERDHLGLLCYHPLTYPKKPENCPLPHAEVSPDTAHRNQSGHVCCRMCGKVIQEVGSVR